MEDDNGEIANEKINFLLKTYAEKVNGKQTSFAAGMRFAMTHLNVVTDEDIHFVLTGKTFKKKKKYKKRA